MNRKVLIFVMAVLALLQPSPAGAAQLGIEPLASWPDARIGNAESIAIDGNHAFATVRLNTLAAFDISNPARPKLISKFPVESPTEIEAAGGRLFVGSSSRRLFVYDVSDPALPTLLATLNTEGSVQGMLVRGDLLFVGAYGNGFQIYNIADPNHVTRLGAFPVFGNARFDLVGDTAYIATGSSVQVLNIADPANPILIGSFNAATRRGVRVRGNYAFVMGNFSAGLQIFDIADLANVIQVAAFFDQTLQFPQDVLNFELKNDIGFVQFSGAEVIALDLSNPANPIQLTRMPSSKLAQEMDVVGDRLWVANGSAGILALDISFPQSASRIGAFQTTTADATSIHVKDQTAFVTGVQHWTLFDLSAPDRLTSVSSASNPANPPRELFPEGTLAYVAMDTFDGFGIFDVANPSVPVRLGVGRILGRLSQSIAAKYPHVYVTTSTSRLLVADVSNPARVTFSADVYSNGVAARLHLNAETLYLVSPSGLNIFDISAPTSPQHRGTFPLQNGSDMDVENGRAYVAARQDGLEIIDVSIPTAPARLGSFATGGIARDVKVSGDRAFVANESGVRVLDITNPAQPSLIASYDTFGTATELDVIGDRIFVADGAEGLVALRAREAAEQSIVFNPPTELYPGESLDLNATASSGLAVEYSFVAGNVGLSATKLHALGAGVVTLEAYQAGNAEFLAAKVRRTINVLTPPTLTATVGERLVLTWPAAHSGFQVEAADSIDATDWTPIVEESQRVGDVFEVAVPLGGGPRFFRLRR